IGPDPSQVAATAAELREEFGITDPEQERADAALVRAAAATDSELVVLPPDEEGPNIPVGAVLRFTTTPDPDNFR
ncbi:peptide chain release factor 1, partial [Micromonospora aurantiaca]|nr:peptide chain release factor 1 [Micromonospora aurantiaca]